MSHRSLLRSVAAAAAIILVGAGVAQAASCSDRMRRCQNYCANNRWHGSVRCTSVCESSYASCRSSGCFETRYGRTCGLAPH